MVAFWNRDQIEETVTAMSRTANIGLEMIMFVSLLLGPSGSITCDYLIIYQIPL